MIYFASDFHLGYPNFEQSLKREKQIVKWLWTIADTADEIHLLGDIFDFWFEWKYVVVKGFTRFLGTLATLIDNGTKVHFYIGNHDIWTFGYLEQEIGLTIHRKREIQTIYGKKLFIEHGDQTPYESVIYKIMTKIFRNRLAQRLYAYLLHPDLASWLAMRFSSRRDRENQVQPFNLENEKHIKYVKWLKQNGFDADFYVFGHRHLPIEFPIEGSKLIVLGDWFKNGSYAVFDGENIWLEEFNFL